LDRPPGSISESLFCGLDIDKYITKKLQEKITAAYNSGKYGDLAGDADYFTHTQDFDAHLTSFMKAKVIKEDRKRAIVRLLVDMTTNFAKPFAVCVRLQRALGCVPARTEATTIKLIVMRVGIGRRCPPDP
jgi:hypothetical protein